jgi:hypothetical protein
MVYLVDDVHLVYLVCVVPVYLVEEVYSVFPVN